MENSSDILSYMSKSEKLLGLLKICFQQVICNLWISKKSDIFFEKNFNASKQRNFSVKK